MGGGRWGSVELGPVNYARTKSSELTHNKQRWHKQAWPNHFEVIFSSESESRHLGLIVVCKGGKWEALKLSKKRVWTLFKFYGCCSSEKKGVRNNKKNIFHYNSFYLLTENLSEGLASHLYLMRSTIKLTCKSPCSSWCHAQSPPGPLRSP